MSIKGLDYCQSCDILGSSCRNKEVITIIAMTITKLIDALAPDHIFVCKETIRKMIVAGTLKANRDHRKYYVFPDGEATIERIKGLYDGTIKPEDEDEEGNGKAVL